MYHDVVPDGCFEVSGFQTPGADIYKLDVTEFRGHLQIIGANAAPESVLITLDDGGSGALQAAAILEESGYAGHFFVTTDRIGSPGFLTEDQIRALRRRGHFLGSHSCSHPPRMSRITPAEMDREWRDSIRALESILDEPVKTASVPGGFYSREVAASAARAGIETLFTSEPVTSVRSVDGCAVLGRFTVRRGVSGRWLAALVSGRLHPRLQQYLAWNGKKLLKTLGGEVWLAARARILPGRPAPVSAGKGTADGQR